ncbi:MAG: hypothetical protein P4M14_02640 [Gammaproteobacteria bacterium]|nr:hypothetical protein [Gammaproteobacteria bacterium]
MAASREEKNDDLKVSTHVHAPSDIGFIHTEKGQFTYFSGSAGGAKTTFGMPAADLVKLISNVSQTFLKAELGNSKTQKELLDAFYTLNQDCVYLLDALNNKRKYTTSEEMNNALLGSGHIPLTMSAIAPASQYEVAVRSVASFHLTEYFGHFPSAAVQAKEYLIKQDMMVQVANFRKTVVQARYAQQPESPEFYFCNRLLSVLDEQIIKVNQKTMPKESAQFDLCHTFEGKVAELIYRMDESLVGEELILNLTLCMNSCRIFQESHQHGQVDNTVERQNKMSYDLYAILGKFADKLGFSGEGDIEVTDEQDKILQNILPLIAYLNSTSNPFARDGLYGKLETNAFHEAALVEYKKHESKERSKPFNFQYMHVKEKHAEYNGDQIEKLLYGSTNEQAKDASATSSFFSSIGKALRNITSDGSVSSSSIQSQSAQRRDRLALPMPKQYLLLEAPKPEVKEFNRPGNSSK